MLVMIISVEYVERDTAETGPYVPPWHLLFLGGSLDSV